MEHFDDISQNRPGKTRGFMLRHLFFGGRGGVLTLRPAKFGRSIFNSTFDADFHSRLKSSLLYPVDPDSDVYIEHGFNLNFRAHEQLDWVVSLSSKKRNIRSSCVVLVYGGNRVVMVGCSGLCNT